MTERHVLVMAGGSGTRLWPASIPERPKHLIGLGPGAPSLLAATLERARALVGDGGLWVITTEAQRPAILDAHPELRPEQVLAEPRGRNTAAAIMYALLQIRAAVWRSGFGADEAVVIALPADHHIAAPSALLTALERGIDEAAEHHTIVTLGIHPTRADTGYGYIEHDGEPLDPRVQPPVYPVRRFVEKPPAEQAALFLATGRFLWNAGIFVLPLARTLSAIHEHAPELAAAFAPVTVALEDEDADREAALVAAYAAVPALPIDIALMEKLRDLRVIPVSVGWNDLGSWAAIHEASDHDDQGNSILLDGAARVHVVDSRDNLIWSEGQEIALIGVSHLAVVAVDGKLLICPLNRAQEVRAIAQASRAE
ncbi:MAG: sugar phosphate nucleotidyltransferase [Nannocystaceae bacterium]